VPLVLSGLLVEAGTPARHVYFPAEGFISLAARVDEHRGLEVGMVGREGMVGAPLAVGVTISPLRALVQGPGSALRMSLASFNLETAVGRARAGRDAARWQGRARTQGALRAACAWRGGGRPRPPRPARPTTLRAHAREEEQRGQRVAAWLNRVRSAVTEAVRVVVAGNPNVHAVLPAEESGQLGFLGSSVN